MHQAPLRIGELARRTGVSADTLRHYERLGLLPAPARTRAGYRQYSPSIISRVQLVRHGLQFGFSLPQLAAFLHVRERGGRPCDDVRAAAGRILAAVETQIAELTAARGAIRAILGDWDHRLARTAKGQRAHLLESLDAAETIPARTPRLRPKAAQRRAART